MIKYKLITENKLTGHYISHLLDLAKIDESTLENANLLILVEPEKIPIKKLEKLVSNLKKNVKILIVSQNLSSVNLPVRETFFLKQPFLTSQFINLIEEISSSHLPLTREERENPFIGEHSSIAKIRNFIPKLASISSPVLLVGAKGTGKELLARHIQAHRGGNFIKFSPKTLASDMIEPVLFGFSASVFPKIKKKKEGLLAKAGEGVLYIEDIDTLPLKTQKKLLSFIENGYFYPLGAKEAVKSSAKLVASLSKPPEEIFKTGKIHTEIFFRLSEFAIYLPSLKKRKIDIPLLAQHFLEKYAHLYRKETIYFSANFIERLLFHSWPSNLDELKKIIKEVVIWGEEETFKRHLPKKIVKNRLRFRDIEDLLSQLIQEEKRIRERTVSSRKGQASRHTGSR
ncbi:Sigma 54 interacting domain protein [Thermodesulfatator indicus DSM 15286]|uniref:Sigma 54 interacting domain protein n=1 Tax=Thermodesulfatator indicus (strain DSM 15286 / JCM 11887 / CIR29812) TaxID=667014 RepID=F8A9L0_THEID|nr:sigma 54-interacting transcriptional regulator [Thermodesulfatator indicus]AEH45236.1 Sigma 54 interacting domain protein [Thermodesulfatator indicus DSM 15286]